MNKKIIVFSAFLIALFNCTGCFLASSPVGTGLFGTQVKAQGIIVENYDAKDKHHLKTGRSTCTNALGLYAFGDCSIKAAMKDGNIKKVYSVDTEINSFLFIHVTTTTIVYGE